MRSHAFGFVSSAISALVLTGGLTLASAPALAQQSDPAQQASNAAQEEVTVIAPRVMRTKVRQPGSRGVGYYDMLTLTHQVSYADLNLAHPGDAKTLRDRVTKAANDVCQELANVSPAEPKSQDCVHSAVRSAMPRAEAAIAAAQGRR